MKTLLDFECEEDIVTANADVNSHLFYGVVGVTFGMLANMVTRATPFWKALIGQNAYFYEIYKDMYKSMRWRFDVEFEGGQKTLADQDIQLMYFNNTKRYIRGSIL